MDSVPYAICASVATLLRDESAKVIRNLDASNPQFDLWAVAAREKCAKRLNLCVHFNRYRDYWYYEIYNGLYGVYKFSFEELKKMNLHHVRVSYIRIGQKSLTRVKSSEEEIRESAAFTARLVNLGAFAFETDDESLRAIPRFYRDGPFKSIKFYSRLPSTHEDFLLPQLQSKFLKKLRVRHPDIEHVGVLYEALNEFVSRMVRFAFKFRVLQTFSKGNAYVNLLRD